MVKRGKKRKAETGRKREGERERETDKQIDRQGLKIHIPIGNHKVLSKRNTESKQELHPTCAGRDI